MRGYVEKLWSVRYALTLLVVFQAFDTMTTLLALRAGGQEANPLMALGLQSGGAMALFWAKHAVIALVFTAIAVDPMEKPYVRAALVIMNGVYALVIGGNLLVYGAYTGDQALPTAFWALMAAIGVVAVEEVRMRRRGAGSA